MSKYESLSLEDVNLIDALENNPGNLGIKDHWYAGLIISDKKLIYDELFTSLPWQTDLTVHSFKDETGYYREYTHHLKSHEITQEFKTSFLEHLFNLNVVVDESEYYNYILAHYMHKNLFIKIRLEECLRSIRIACYYER